MPIKFKKAGGSSERTYLMASKLFWVTAPGAGFTAPVHLAELMSKAV